MTICDWDGWEPDPDHGELVFNAHAYTIPNYAVRFVDWGAFDLLVPTLEGDDVEVLNGAIAYPRRERTRIARLVLQVNFAVDTAGTPYGSRTEGHLRNWSDLNAIAATSISTAQTGTGLQSLTWTPHASASPVTFNAHVLPPDAGAVDYGKGMMAGMIVQVPDPTALP